MLRIAYGLAKSEYDNSLRTFYASALRNTHPLLDRATFEWYFGGHKSFDMDRLTIAASWNEEGIIVGHLGVVPVTLLAYGEKYCFAWLINLAVVEDYRRVGLATRLINKVREHFDGVLMLGSTAAGLALHRRNGAAIVGVVNRHLKILSPARVRALMVGPAKLSDQVTDPSAYRLASPSGRYRKPASFQVPSDYPSLWRRTARLVAATVDRSANYLHWRYAENPQFEHLIIAARSASGRLDGILVFRIDSVSNAPELRIIKVLDIVALPSAFGRLLDRLEYFARSVDAVAIECFLGPSNYASNLRDHGYTATPGDTILDQFPRLFHPIRTADPAEVHFSFMLRDPVQQSKIGEAIGRSFLLTASDSDLDRVQR